MKAPLRLAITADLHWGSHRDGDAAVRGLVAFLEAQPPDVLILAGDIGAASHFEECLALFSGLSCWKALVPGNHDIWVAGADLRGDSLKVYQEHLPAICKQHRFHYLDRGPLVMPDSAMAIVGTMNWYDYSWSLAALKKAVPDWEQRLRTKRFAQGRHNDANYVRWKLNDDSFTKEVVAVFSRSLRKAFAQVPQVLVVTHHPAFHGLAFPRPEGAPITMDSLLWEAFSGNSSLEDLLRKHSDSIPLVFCGHTHRERENTLGRIRGYNIGGDYHFKRLLLVDWPAKTVEAHVFGKGISEPEA